MSLPAVTNITVHHHLDGVITQACQYQTSPGTDKNNEEIILYFIVDRQLSFLRLCFTQCTGNSHLPGSTSPGIVNSYLRLCSSLCTVKSHSQLYLTVYRKLYLLYLTRTMKSHLLCSSLCTVKCHPQLYLTVYREVSSLYLTCTMKSQKSHLQLYVTVYRGLSPSSLYLTVYHKLSTVLPSCLYLNVYRKLLPSQVYLITYRELSPRQYLLMLGSIKHVPVEEKNKV